MLWVLTHLYGNIFFLALKIFGNKSWHHGSVLQCCSMFVFSVQENRLQSHLFELCANVDLVGARKGEIFSHVWSNKAFKCCDNWTDFWIDTETWRDDSWQSYIMAETSVTHKLIHAVGHCKLWRYMSTGVSTQRHLINMCSRFDFCYLCCKLGI